MVIVWDYKEGTMMGSYETHKVCVEDLCFTCNSDFLVSLGGRDDGHVIVWDVQKNSLTCGILSAVFKIFFYKVNIKIIYFYKILILNIYYNIKYNILILKLYIFIKSILDQFVQI